MTRINNEYKPEYSDIYFRQMKDLTLRTLDNPFIENLRKNNHTSVGGIEHGARAASGDKKQQYSSMLSNLGVRVVV